MHALLADRPSAMLHQPEGGLAQAGKDAVLNRARGAEGLADARQPLGAHRRLRVERRAIFVRRRIGAPIPAAEADRAGQLVIGRDHVVGQDARAGILLERAEDHLAAGPRTAVPPPKCSTAVSSSGAMVACAADADDTAFLQAIPRPTAGSASAGR